MDENGRGRVQSRDEDWLSNLPESLIFQVLLNLPTKDVVKTSVLSSRWRNLWKVVPGLDLEYNDFPVYNAFVRFVDMFLGFNGESCLQNFKLDFDRNVNDEPYIFRFKRWFNTVVERKVQHLHVSDDSPWMAGEIRIPPTVYTCESLVSLKLCCVTLPNPEFVSLPCVKAMVLDMVEFANGLAFEMLISGCPVLESLDFCKIESDNVQVLRLCSQSLLRFTLNGHGNSNVEDQVVAIDAPKLEYLKLHDYETESFIINNPGSLVKADINILFNFSLSNQFDPNDLPKRNMIRNFLVGISTVKDMVISSNTLKIIYDYSRCEQLPLFPNLSFIHADLFNYRWEMLTTFLEGCRKLKSLSLGFSEYPGEEGVSILSGPHCLLPSLEFVKIVKEMVWEETAMKLVSYFLERSAILKKFTLCLNSRKKEKSVILKKLLAIPRLSSSCQIVVL